MNQKWINFEFPQDTFHRKELSDLLEKGDINQKMNYISKSLRILLTEEVFLIYRKKEI